MSNLSISPRKKCTKCKREFPPTLEYFYAHNGIKCGLNPQCKECSKAKHKKWYGENREYKLRKNQDWYDKHPEAKKAKHQKRYWSDPEKQRKRSADYKANNADKVRKRQKEWNKNNPDKIREQARIRRVRKQKADGTHSIADERLQFKTQNGKCWWCGKKIKGQYHVDHRIPLSRGGSDWPDNIVISCPKCNESKRNKMPWEWNGRLV